ncbi:GyrI-like domain-containing protein [Aquabacter cavernae]|uniref:GyrI-like domain-containing protein n=1 Tax=Aquabacter cavernae TaxID=2496029 RepID=UPI000F8E5EEF|nr:GyrI-like domain-containing protein [Aquabacter cavernae]
MTFGNLIRGALVLMLASGSALGSASAQAPASPPAATPAPTDAPAPSAPAVPAPAAPAPEAAQAPAAPASPAPGGAIQSAPLPAPGTAAPPPAAATPAPPAAGPGGPPHTDTVTGETQVLNPMPVLVKTGSASWEEGFDTIVATVDAITAEMNRIGLKRTGDVIVSYTSSDEAGFEFEAQVPFTGQSAEKPGDGVKIGASFAGRVMKFHHSGSFADMDTTYEGIANYLDSRNIEGQDFYIERYVTDPSTAAPEALEVDIFVPLR